MNSRPQLGFVVPAAASAAGGPAGALIGAGITLATTLIGAIIRNSGCGPTCVLASQLVDQLEPQLARNRDAYLNGPHTAELQREALANFDTAWAWLSSSQACGSPELGDAGRRCISERNRGGKWDWFRLYRDPIAAASPDPIATAAAVTEFPSTWLLAAAALILLGVML